MCKNRSIYFNLSHSWQRAKKLMGGRDSSGAGLSRISVVTTLVVGAAFIFCIFGYVYRHYFLRVFGLSIIDFEFSPFEAAFFAMSQLADITVFLAFLVVAASTLLAVFVLEKMPPGTLAICLPVFSGLLLLSVVFGARTTAENRAREVIEGDAGRTIFCDTSGNTGAQFDIWEVTKEQLPTVKLLMMTEGYLYVFYAGLMVPESSLPPQAAIISRANVDDCFLDGYVP